MTFEEFEKRFATEAQCRDYLFELRWLDGFVCPKCENRKAWPVGSVLFECSKCGHQASVIAGTIFQDTRKPLKAWFTAIWWVTTQKNGANATGLQQVLGFKSYETAWTWLHKIRAAMVRPDRSPLSGVVEVDETYVGGKVSGGKPGRGSENKTLVNIAVEVKDNGQLGRIRLKVIDDASKNSLHGFISESVLVGSTVQTDGWSGYLGLVEKGYVHEVTVQSKTGDDEEMMPHVHLVVSLLKRWLLGTHQGAVRTKHLQSYLDEYTFRFNRRNSARRGLLFYRLLECAVVVQPLTYNDLVGKSNTT